MIPKEDTWWKYNEPFFCLNCDDQLQDKSKPVCSDKCADEFQKQCEADMSELKKMTDLTKEELIKLAEIAGKVVEKHPCVGEDVYIVISKNGTEFLKKWNPAERIAQAMEVLSALQAKDNNVKISIDMYLGGRSVSIQTNYGECVFRHEENWVEVEDENLTIAICKAVLKASEEG